MSVYSFNIVTEGFDLNSEEQNAAIESLNYVAVVGRVGGVTSIDVEIEAASPVDAYLQVASDLKAIRVVVLRIDTDLVNVSEIAIRLNVSRETVRLWAAGQRREGFPDHFAIVSDSKVWRWSEVYLWAVVQGCDVDECEPLGSNVVDALNGALAHSRYGGSEGWLQPSRTPVVHLGTRQRKTYSDGWRDVRVGAA